MIKILGHRLANGDEFYENTYPSLLESLDCCDGIETDAVRTSDSKVFLVHDTAFYQQVEYELSRHLDETSIAFMDGRRLDQITAADAKNLRLKNGCDIPRLEKLFETARPRPDFYMNLELKGEDVAKAVITEVHDAIGKGLVSKEQIQISSFNHNQLIQTRSLDPDLAIGMLFALGSQDTGNRLHPWSDHDKGEYIPFNLDYLADDVARGINPNFINLDITDITQENVTAIKKLFPNAMVMIWFLYEDPPETNEKLFDLLKNPAISPHIAAVMSNHPRRTVSALKAQGIISA